MKLEMKLEMKLHSKVQDPKLNAPIDYFLVFLMLRFFADGIDEVYQ